ncbi:uncharacterized protein LOC110810032 isoform X3 [Carica papaya]|uniref:uncharacterized protein LOC110810032 isoform X3 n=1 Tax=Carica papaya TaxID=3649 RepID=UPI000B8C8617|nr:uncharacterized protein LOC110810032 isoform X3 [Carica papaya]
MGIEGKNVQLFLWRVFRVSVTTTYKFVRKHPVFSGVLFLCFLLYSFLPSVFYFLLYSSPVLFCTVIYAQNCLNSRRVNFQNVFKDGKEEKGGSSIESMAGSADQAVQRRDRSYLKPQRSVRRNARRKVEEMSTDWDPQEGEERKDKVILTTLYNDLLGRKPVFEESPKAIEMENENSSFGPGLVSSDGGEDGMVLDSENSKPDMVSFDGPVELSEKLTSGGGETEVESLGEDDDEEDVHEDGNKAVEWTEDDQKNLMDLGISELERNRRLENLIARRRARKLFKLTAEKSLIDMDTVPSGQILPILVTRSNPFDAPDNPDDCLQTPGSAPPILLPARNPFDLPYDPQEEKPDLMGDSFQQEFSVAPQKDMFFCRHESFCRGLYPSEPMQDQQDPKADSYLNSEKWAAERPGCFGYRRQSGFEGPKHIVEQITEEGEPISNIENNHDFVNQGGRALNEIVPSLEVIHEEPTGSGNNNNSEVREDNYHIESRTNNGSEVQMETDSIRNEDSESNSSSSPSDREQVFGFFSQTETSENQNRRVSKYPFAFGDSFQTSLHGSIPKFISGYENSYDTHKLNDGHGYYKGKMSCHTPSYSIASDLQVEVSEVGSPPTVDGNLSADGESCTYDGDHVEKDIASGSEEIWGASYQLPRMEEGEPNLIETTEVSEGYDVRGEISDINKEPVDPIESSTASAEVAQQDFNNTSSLSSLRAEISKKIQDQCHVMNMDNKTQEHVIQVVQNIVDPRPSVSLNAFSPGSSEKAQHTTDEPVILPPPHVYSEVPDVQLLDIMQEFSNGVEKSAEEMKVTYDFDEPVIHEKVDLKPIEDRDDNELTLNEEEALNEQTKPTEYVNLGSSEVEIREDDNSNNTEGDNRSPNQGNEIFEAACTSRVEEIYGEGMVSGIGHTFDDSISLTMQVEQSTEAVSTSSSSCSSPRSVLVDLIPTDQTSLLNFEEWDHMDSPPSYAEDAAGDNSLDGQPSGSLSLNVPESTQHLVESSVTSPSNNSDSDKWEPSGYQNESNDEASAMVKEANHELSKSEDGSSNQHILRTKDIEEVPAHSPGKLTEENNTTSMDDLAMQKSKDEETLQSVENGEEQYLFSVKQVNIVEPHEEIFNAKHAEDVEGNFEKSDEVNSDPLKVNDEDVSSVTTEESNSGNLREQKGILVETKLADGEENFEAIGNVPGESDVSEEHDASIYQSKETFEADQIDSSVAAVEEKEPPYHLLHDSTTVVVSMSDENEPASEKMTYEENLTHLSTSQSAKEAVVEEAMPETMLLPAQGSESEPEDTADGEVNAHISSLIGENNSLNGAENTQESVQSIDQENITVSTVPDDTKGESKELNDDGSEMSTQESVRLIDQENITVPKIADDIIGEPKELNDNSNLMDTQESVQPTVPDDTKGESKELNHDGIEMGTQGSVQLIDQEDITMPTVPDYTKGESKELNNDGIDMGTELIEPVESEVKALNTEGKDDHTEAK